MRNKYRFFHVFVYFWAVMYLVSCSQTNENQSLSQGETISEKIPIPSNLEAVDFTGDIPYFLNDVWPHPGSTIQQKDYRGSSGKSSGISITISIFDLDNLALYQDSTDIVPIQLRSYLFVDGEIVPDDTLRVWDGLQSRHIKIADDDGNVLFEDDIEGGPYTLDWAPKLHQGNHNVEFLVLSNTGELLKYSWTFYLEE